MNPTEQKINGLNKTFAPFITKGFSSYGSIPAVHIPNDKFETKEQKETKTNKKLLKLSLSIFGVSAALMLLFKGKSDLLVKNYNKIIAKIEDKIDLLEAQKTHNSIGKIHDYSIIAYKKMKKTLVVLECFTHIASLKDLYTEKILKNKSLNKFYKLGEKYADGTKNWFTQMSINTTIRKWEEARIAFEDIVSLTQTNANYLRTNAKNLKCGEQFALQRAAELDKQAEELSKSIGKYIDDFYKAGTTPQTRIERMKNKLKDISELLEKDLNSKEKSFWNKVKEAYKNQTAFRAEAILRDRKKELLTEANKFRKEISNSINDICSRTEEILDEIRFTIAEMNDKTGKKEIKELKDLIKKYRQPTAGNKDDIRQETLEQINIKLNNLIETFKNKVQNEETKKIFGQLQEAKNELQNNQRGVLQKIRQTFKYDQGDDILNILGPESEQPKYYKELKENLDIAAKRLDTAITSENHTLFDKIRDLNIGSAPTDVGGLIIPLALTGYAMGQADTKEKKTSIALKAGFPAVGAVGTCLIAQVKQISGPLALVYASFAAWGLNKIGSVIDKKVKEFNEKQSAS